MLLEVTFIVRAFLKWVGVFLNSADKTKVSWQFVEAKRQYLHKVQQEASRSPSISSLYDLSRVMDKSGSGWEPDESAIREVSCTAPSDRT